jgi:hypothetical protein
VSVAGAQSLKTQIPVAMVAVLYVVLLQHTVQLEGGGGGGSVVDRFTPLPQITIGVTLSLLSSRIIVEGGWVW